MPMLRSRRRRPPAAPRRDVADPRSGLDPADPANAALLAACPVCGMTDGDVGPVTWRGWPAHSTCLDWLDDPPSAGHLTSFGIAEAAAVAAVSALLDGGTLRFYDGTPPIPASAPGPGRLLAALRLGTPAFDPPVISRSAVRAVARPIEPGTAIASGTARYFALVRADGETVVRTGTIGQRGAELSLTPDFITRASRVEVGSFDTSIPLRKPV